MALSCTGPGREYCSQHFLTDPVRAFQGEGRYSGDLPEDKLSLNSLKLTSDNVHPLLFRLVVTSSCASTQQFNMLQVIP